MFQGPRIARCEYKRKDIRVRLRAAASALVSGGREIARVRGASNIASSYRIGTLRVVENSVQECRCGHSTSPGREAIRDRPRCAAPHRIALHRTAPHPAMQSCIVCPCARARGRSRGVRMRNHANVTRVWCSCGPWRLVPWRWRLLQPRPVRARPASILDRHRPP